MAVARSGFVSLDCADPLALGEFWAAMLGGEIMFASTTTVGIRTDCVWPRCGTRLSTRPFMEERLGEALAKGGVTGPPSSITWIELVAHHHLGS